MRAQIPSSTPFHLATPHHISPHHTTPRHALSSRLITPGQASQTDLGGFGIPSWVPKSIKIIKNSISKYIPSWIAFFDRFLIDFCSQLVTPEPTKSLKFYWFYRHFLLFGIFKIRSKFDPILVPTCLHFPSPKFFQIASKIDFHRH